MDVEEKKTILFLKDKKKETKYYIDLTTLNMNFNKN